MLNDKTLVLGCTGFLGQSLLNSLVKDSTLSIKEIRDKYIFLGHDPVSSTIVSDKYGLEVSPSEMLTPISIENILITQKITKIINLSGFIPSNASTSKEVMKCIESNFIGIYNLIILAKKYNIKEYLGMGSINSLNSSSIYGLTKSIAELFIIENGYSFISSPNIFGSKNSVLDKWHNQMKNNLSLTVTDVNCIRYFVEAKTIINLINNAQYSKGLIHPETVYSISLGDLIDSFKEVFSYDKVKVLNLQEDEILEYKLPFDSKILNPSKEEIKSLIKNWRSNYQS